MTSKSAGHSQHEDKDLAEAARKSVEQIWQAGLGAFARAREEGEDMFSRLVDEGIAVQERTRQFAEDRFEDMNATITKMADSFGKQASGSLDRLESVFEDRIMHSVHRSLQRLGVPTHDEIQGLSRQLAKLQETLDAMAGKKTDQKGTQKAATRPVKAASTRTATRTSGKRSGSVSARA